jgi:hypothetical protein
LLAPSVQAQPKVAERPQEPGRLPLFPWAEARASWQGLEKVVEQRLVAMEAE